MTETRYKLIALDMDGTVLNEEGHISAENREWIRKAVDSGITVMFCTGRGMPTVKPYTTELGLQGPVVTINGGEVWRTPGELHARHLMKTEWIVKMRQIAIDTDTWYWAYDTSGKNSNRENWTGTEEDREWLKFGYFTDNAEKLARIRRELESWDVLEITNSHPSNLELNPKGVNKASGLAEVCGLLGIGMEQVIAMGDSLNDIAAIRAAGLGIAMGNAQDEVKAAADDVTETNLRHGVAAAIRKHVFGS